MIDHTSVKSSAEFSGTANLKKHITCTPTVVNGHLIVKSSVAFSETGKKNEIHAHSHRGMVISVLRVVLHFGVLYSVNMIL